MNQQNYIELVENCRKKQKKAMLNEQEKLDQDIQEKLEKKKQKQKKQEQEMQDVQEHLQPISEERRWAKFEA